MFSINLVSLPLKYNEKLFFSLFVIFKEPSFKAFYFRHCSYWNYVLILMLIRQVNPLIASLPPIFIYFFGDYLIYWKSKNQNIHIRPSTKVEYHDMPSITIEISWLHWILSDIDVRLFESSPIYCDKKSDNQIAHSSIFYKHVKHIDIDYRQFTHHHLQRKTILCCLSLPPYG